MNGDPLKKGCPNCGSSDGRDRAFVQYDADPNDAQSECEWAGEIPGTLYAFVCTECSCVLGTVDARDPEDLPDDIGTSDFRVDEDLK